jgi:hypothetical protein
MLTVTYEAICINCAFIGYTPLFSREGQLCPACLNSTFLTCNASASQVQRTKSHENENNSDRCSIHLRPRG